jgi:hypothetical protein
MIPYDPLVEPDRAEAPIPVSISGSRLARSLNLLHFRGQGWMPLRPWMRFFVELGDMLNQAFDGRVRLTVGVSVPARPYTALFAGLGAVLSGAMQGSPSSQHTRAYFEYLAGLPIGTPVSWHRGVSTVLGRLAGTRELNGESLLMIQTAEKGSFKQSCSIDGCEGVQVLDEDIQLAKNPGKGRPVRGRVPLLEELLPTRAVFSFVSQNVLSVLVVGTASQVTTEAESAQLAVAKSTGYIRAGLDELLRVRRPGHPGDSYRSLIVGSYSPAVAKLTRVLPRTVVFDGALPYLRWRGNWPSSSALLVIDRSEAHAEEAAAALDQDRALYSTMGWELDPSVELPDGIEITGYRTEVVA